MCLYIYSTGRWSSTCSAPWKLSPLGSILGLPPTIEVCAYTHTNHHIFGLNIDVISMWPFLIRFVSECFHFLSLRLEANRPSAIGGDGPFLAFGPFQFPPLIIIIL